MGRSQLCPYDRLVDEIPAHISGKKDLVVDIELN